MATTKKDPVLVVLQLTGANDYLNTIVPYNNGHYRDARPRVSIAEDQVLPIDVDGGLGFNPNMGPVKQLYDEGKVAVIHGIGYENSPWSHFRSLDIWHTCEPDIVGTEGWAGKVIRDLDPIGENVLKGVNFGQGLPRALALRGVPVTSVSNLESYGVLSNAPGVGDDREQILERFARMYSPAVGTGAVMDYLGQIGRDALRGADIIKVAPEKYSSTIEYAETPIAAALRDVARVHLADLGTQVFYTQHVGYDTHFNQPPAHVKLWTDLSRAISDFFDDLNEHDAGDDVVMMLFTEFGRRVKDNGTGTDHGAGGVAFVIGNQVKGGMYGTYPSIRPEDLSQGDLAPNYDFRGFYSTIVDRWLGLDPVPIVGGKFEQMDFV